MEQDLFEKSYSRSKWIRNEVFQCLRNIDMRNFPDFLLFFVHESAATFAMFFGKKRIKWAQNEVFQVL